MSIGENIFEEFDAVTAKEWKNKIEQDLKGKSFDELIQHNTEGFDIDPFYVKEQITALDIPARENANWQIRQDFIAIDFEQTNQTITEAINFGVDAIGIEIRETFSVNQFEILLKDIDLSNISIHFFGGENDSTVARNFVEFIQKQNFNPNNLTGSFDFDLSNKENISTYLFASQYLPLFKLIVVHHQGDNNSVANVVDEISGMMQKLNRVWENLIANNQQPAIMILQVQFDVTISPNYFMEIAKLRALRWLWEKWQQNHGIENPIPTFIQAQKSWQHNDDEDPYHNILLHTTEAMAAVIGGCDVLNLRSNDTTAQFDNAFFERISRNLQHILKHESHLDKVADPAKGSYYIESLTKKLVAQVEDFV